MNWGYDNNNSAQYDPSSRDEAFGLGVILLKYGCIWSSSPIQKQLHFPHTRRGMIVDGIPVKFGGYTRRFGIWINPC
ncbi:unnamed protein product [Sphagnum troendelagicum]